MTPQQLAAIKTDIAANGDLNAQPNTSDGAFEISRLYNLPASPTFLVWRTDAPVTDIEDAITWSAYTPNDAADNTVLFGNRNDVIKIKQINLQLMLQGKDRIDASKLNVRAGLRDAVINLPSGTGGASQSAGGASGVTVLTACTRNATRLEKLLIANTPAAIGGVTASVMGFEGQVSPADIFTARAV